MSTEIYEKIDIKKIKKNFSLLLSHCNNKMAAAALKTAGVKGIKKEKSFLLTRGGKTFSCMTNKKKTFMIQVSAPTREDEKGLFKIIGKNGESRYFIVK